MKKRMLSFIFCLFLCFGLLPNAILADEVKNDEENVVTYQEVIELPRLETSAQMLSFYAQNGISVDLSAGNHAQWIDRLNLSEHSYAEEFYHWLIENSSDETGALVNPVVSESNEVTSLGNDYVHFVTSLNGTVSYTGDPGDAVNAAIGTKPDEISAYLTAAYIAFDRDCPEVFWLSDESRVTWTLGYAYGDGTANYEVNIYFVLKSDEFDIRETGYQTVAQIEAGMTQRDNFLNYIKQETEGKNSYNFTKTVNEILTENNAYYYEEGKSAEDAPFLAHKCLSAMPAVKTEEGKWVIASGNSGAKGPVCEGYARAFKAAADYCGHNAVLVDGLADGAHMWNYMKVEDAWYAVDVTWNDPVVTGNETKLVSGYENENYLLVGSDTVVSEKSFSASHIMQNTVTANGVAFTNEPTLAKNKCTGSDEVVCLHKETEIRNAKAATCTAKGYTGDTYCKSCGVKRASGTTIPVAGHNYGSSWKTDNGKHWHECTVCGAKKDETSHTVGTAATCIQKAVCGVCKASFGTVNGNVHKETEIRNAKAATYTEQGYTGDTYCKACNTKTASGTVIEKLPKPTETPETKPENQPTETPETKPENQPTEPTVTNGWEEKDGQSYWYEDGVLQGTEGRGKEIYDPQTDAWYWLDSVLGGAVAKNKDVYQESDAGIWAERADGTGKWVRYDENGHMVKGWQDTDAGRYYFDTIYGTMAKGYATIDGVEYYFAEDTGVLLYEIGTVPEFGWAERDGQKFWYEGSVRQGFKVDDNYRGKEIYDSQTDAWYWLDNVLGGAIAVSKDVYQESYSAYPDRPDGTGKWVRYDENGRMVKGWQTTEAGTYYFEEVTGSMAKGRVTIDDREYYFDETTGILQ